MSGSSADRAVKRARLDVVRERAGGAALALTSHEAVSWYLEGPRTHVSFAAPPVLAVRVDDEGDTIYVPENERDRLVEEELLAEDGARVVALPWEVPPAEAPGLEVATSESAVAAWLRAARAELLPAETARYRALGADLAAVLTGVARSLSARDTERDAASRLSAAATAAGIDPLVVLVSGTGRLAHRHPLPTPAVLGARAMLVLGGRRHGLFANATRWIDREGPREVDRRILEVERAYLDATRPGASLADVLRAGAGAYAAAGFPADEWRRHHQGGPTGYAGRDPRATASAVDVVRSGQAFAWNPTAHGAKVEDTMLLTDGGFEVLTRDPGWPTSTIGGRARPIPLAV